MLLYHLRITLWIEMEEELKERFLPQTYLNLSLDPSLNHVSQPSVSHLMETEYHHGQPMFDLEFVAPTTSNLVEIKMSMDQLHQICKDQKEPITDIMSNFVKLML